MSDNNKTYVWIQLAISLTITIIAGLLFVTVATQQKNYELLNNRINELTKTVEAQAKSLEYEKARVNNKIDNQIQELESTTRNRQILLNYQLLRRLSDEK